MIAVYGFADLGTSTPTHKSSTTSPMAAIRAVELKDLRSLRDGILVSTPRLLALVVILTGLPKLVTGLGTPNYPAMLSLFMSMP